MLYSKLIMPNSEPERKTRVVRSPRERIETALITRILSGHLPPGAPLDPDELRDRYDAGPKIIGGVLTNLNAMGLVTRKHGIGDFVSNSQAALAYQLPRPMETGLIDTAQWKDDVRALGLEPGAAHRIEVVESSPDVSERLGLSPHAVVRSRNLVRFVGRGRRRLVFDASSEFVPEKWASKYMGPPDTWDQQPIREAGRSATVSVEVVAPLPREVTQFGLLPEDQLLSQTVTVSDGGGVPIYDRMTIMPPGRGRIVFSMPLQ